MRRTFKRGLATILSILFVVASVSTNSFAAENPDQVATGELSMQVNEVAASNPETEVVEPMSTYGTKIYLINQTSTISSDSYIPFTAIQPYNGNVHLRICAKYDDGHTGGASVRFSDYLFAIPVDGVTRMYDTKITLDSGNYNFKITGVKGKMTITIELYALV